MAHINHIGLYVSDLEASKAFYEKYFGAVANEKYHNPKKEFSSYLLSFDDSTRLEIMTKPYLSQISDRTRNFGYAHISISVGSPERVDQITRRLIEDGYDNIDGPRTTGDGFYESTILDFEGNIIEITI